MQKYDSYKDSGVQWLGEIPRHWDSCKLRRLCAIVRGGSPRPIESFLSDEGYNWIKIGDTIKGNKYITATKQKIKKSGLSATRLVHPGDLILTNSMSFGNPYILDIEGCIHDGWLAFSMLKGICKEYLYYFLLSDFCANQFKLQVDGGVVQNLNIDKVKDTWIAIPTLIEQNAMVAYLDAATAKIDKAIAQQQKMIALLNERKQIIINNAVTKGLNPDVKMKDSGVEWIGMVPEGWEVMKLNYNITVQCGYPFDSNKFSTDKGFPLIRIRDITSGKSETLFDGTYDEIYIVKKNDLLIGMDGDFNVRWWEADEALLNQRCCRIFTKNNLYKRFLYYLLPIPLKYINDLTPATTVKHLSDKDIRGIIGPLPSLDEQKNICSYLDVETIQLDRLMGFYTKQISLLRERKQIIINEVVTGKVKVC